MKKRRPSGELVGGVTALERIYAWECEAVYCPDAAVKEVNL
jgi:hypothetical protein